MIPVSDTVTSSYMRNLTKVNLSVYPNPCSYFLNIETDVENFTATIHDTSGKMLYKKRNQSVVHIGGLCKGVYYLSIKGDGGTRAQQIRFLKL